MQLTGAQTVLRALEDEGIDTIFGLPGGSVIPLYDAIFDSPIRHVLVRHEQAAAHAADGYSRAGDGVGVCIATSGPGATNLITGIATAHHDSSPMLVLTGQVSSSVIGTDFFQEAHILGISLPIVKHSMQARSPKEIPTMIHDGLRIAKTGRPGPVLIDLPNDVQKEMCEYAPPRGTFCPAYSERISTDISRLDDAADIIRGALRPVIIAGNGVNISRAYEELREFAEQLEIPVATSLLGKGVISDNSPLSIGMLGMHGTSAANRAIINADVIIAVGTRFSDRSTGRRTHFGSDAKIIHIDIDIAEIDKNIMTDVWLLGDAANVLKLLLEEARGHDSSTRRAWMEEIRRMENKEPLRRESTSDIVRSWQVFEAVDDLTKGRAVITTEVGQHQMNAALYHRSITPRSFLTSGGQGAMGFGIPASIGAHFARPDVPIICIAGDGSAMMNIQELDTYARYELPIKVIVMDNNCLGMVRQWQELFFNERYSSTLYDRSPDFCAIARGMGVEAFEVGSPRDLRGAIERALEVDGPALVHVPLPREENVFPMVPAGASLHEMIV